MTNNVAATATTTVRPRPASRYTAADLARERSESMKDAALGTVALAATQLTIACSSNPTESDAFYYRFAGEISDSLHLSNEHRDALSRLFLEAGEQAREALS